MSAALKTRKQTRADDEPELTMQQRAERRMRERIEAYRALVTRAAHGEKLTGEELEHAGELLDQLGLPASQWQNDIDGIGELERAMAEEAKLKQRQIEADARLLELQPKIEAMQVELDKLRLEQRNLVALPMVTVGVVRHINEVRAKHRHCLGDIEHAVGVALRRQLEGTKSVNKELGWGELPAATAGR